jgi:hypothetical protein
MSILLYPVWNRNHNCLLHRVISTIKPLRLLSHLTDSSVPFQVIDKRKVRFSVRIFPVAGLICGLLFAPVKRVCAYIIVQQTVALLFALELSALSLNITLLLFGIVWNALIILAQAICLRFILLCVDS